LPASSSGRVLKDRAGDLGRAAAARTYPEDGRATLQQRQPQRGFIARTVVERPKLCRAVQPSGSFSGEIDLDVGHALRWSGAASCSQILGIDAISGALAAAAQCPLQHEQRR
jgi:hypothetical protein